MSNMLESIILNTIQIPIIVIIHAMKR